VWEIRKVEDVHTCATQLITQDHRHLGSKIISQHVRQMVESNLSTPIATIISFIQTSMGYNTTYRKTWLAKQQTIEDVYENWEQSYNRLSCLLQVMQTYLSGFVNKLKTSPITDGDDVLQNQQHFRKVLWTFKQCIDGFSFCKPIVQVDGTFLYGRYKGTLLVVVAQDGRNNIFPIAFAIVEGETAEVWFFFP